MKRHRNSDTKTGNKEPQQNYLRGVLLQKNDYGDVRAEDTPLPQFKSENHSDIKTHSIGIIYSMYIKSTLNSASDCIQDNIANKIMHNFAETFTETFV